MYRARVRTSASRTTSSARTCRRAADTRWAGRYAPTRHASLTTVSGWPGAHPIYPPNSSQDDTDRDKVGNVCDACPATANGDRVNAKGCNLDETPIRRALRLVPWGLSDPSAQSPRCQLAGGSRWFAPTAVFHKYSRKGSRGHRSSSHPTDRTARPLHECYCRTRGLCTDSHTRIARDTSRHQCRHTRNRRVTIEDIFVDLRYSELL